MNHTTDEKKVYLKFVKLVLAFVMLAEKEKIYQLSNTF